MKTTSFLARAVTIALVALFTSTVTASAMPRVTNVYTVRNDHGGYVIDYAIKMLRMDRAQRPVKFAGRCDSACTLFLALDRSRTCIAPGARFGFHLPFGSTARGNKVAANFLLKNYPQWVRSWLQSKGGLSKNLKVMPYEYASRHIKPCSGKAPLVQQARLSLNGR